MAMSGELNRYHCEPDPETTACLSPAASLLPMWCKYCTVCFYNSTSYRTHIHRHRLKYGKSPWHQTPHHAFTKLAPRHRLHNRSIGANKSGSVEKKSRANSPPQDVRNGNKRFMHRCRECIRIFPSLSQLRKHAQKHRLQCKVTECRAIFDTLASLNAHNQIHATKRRQRYITEEREEYGLHSCPVCQREFAKRLQVKFHIRNIHLKGKLPDFEIWNKCQFFLFDGHVRRACEFCLKIFKNVHQLWIHMKVYASDLQHYGQVYQCTICQKRFKSNLNLVMHRDKEHIEKKPYECAFCDEYFNISESKHHMMIATPKRKYNCPTCTLKCQSKCHLKSHVGKYHNIQYGTTNIKSVQHQITKQSNCVVKNLDVIKDDEKSTATEDCQYCKTTCTLKCQSKCHLKSHVGKYHNIQNGTTNIKSLQHQITKQSNCVVINLDVIKDDEKSTATEDCQYCKKPISTDDMSKHILSMHPDKPVPGQITIAQKPSKYVCKVCFTSFLRRKKLRHHMKKEHTSPQVRPHKCPRCVASFAARGTLNRHIQQVHHISPENRRKKEHTPPQVRAHKCPVCVASFAARGTLNRHIRGVHSKSPETKRKLKRYKCVACWSYFSKRKNLNTHMHRKHPDVPHDPKRNVASSLAKKSPSRHRCLFCRSAFTKRDTLVMHMSDKHACEGVPIQRVSYILPDVHQANLHNGNPVVRNNSAKIAATATAVIHSKPALQEESNKSSVVASQHTSNHKGYSCEFCNKRFVMMHNLKKHIQNCHPKEDNQKESKNKPGYKGYSCEFCPKRFVMIHNLKKHVQVYHPKKENYKESNQPSVVVSQHTSQHKGYMCEYCNTRFVMMHNLTKHVQACHPKEEDRQFKCGYCRKGFAKKVLLCQHMISEHIGEDI